MNQNIFVSLEEKISSEKDSVNNEKSSKKKRLRLDRSELSDRSEGSDRITAVFINDRVMKIRG